jgi:hypothetical protein
MFCVDANLLAELQSISITLPCGLDYLCSFLLPTRTYPGDLLCFDHFFHSALDDT